jgi:dTDP-4-amino-4,6-dideoxygalactose transaminase
VGLNSRLDAIQAAILRVKLRHLDEFTHARRTAADVYDRLLEGCPNVVTPVTDPKATHVFHQYTIRLAGAEAGVRDELASTLRQHGIASAIYYPAPIYHFDAYRDGLRGADSLPHTEQACREVLSLPMHSELTIEQQERVVQVIGDFVGGLAHG